MLIEIILALLLGITAGTFTGLIPGIHINLISALIIPFTLISSISINPLYLIIFVVAMSITHTFLDFIPSIFLGCPDTDTELSILPGHKLLKKGFGYEAVLLTCYGSFAAIFILVIITVPSVFIISKLYDTIKILIPYLLIVSSIFLILTERNKISALLVFTLSGILGLCVLNISTLKEPLLPLLTGLFGCSMLIMSIKNKTKIAKQKITKPKTNLFRPLIGAIIASPLCSFLPGLGSGQAAIIGNTISKTNDKNFLILLGATNTLVMGFSFISLYTISKTRTGAAVAIHNLIGEFSIKILILILSTTLIAGIISFFLTIYLAKIFSIQITKVNYTKISLTTLIFLGIIVFLASGLIGLFILFVSTLTGIYCISFKVRRTNMMGCLLLPTIIIYLF